MLFQVLALTKTRKKKVLWVWNKCLSQSFHYFLSRIWLIIRSIIVSFFCKKKENRCCTWHLGTVKCKNKILSVSFPDQNVQNFPPSERSQGWVQCLGPHIYIMKAGGGFKSNSFLLQKFIYFPLHVIFSHDPLRSYHGVHCVLLLLIPLAYVEFQCLGPLGKLSKFIQVISHFCTLVSSSETWK